MVIWREEMLLPVNIEKVWSLFDLENIQRIMPQVVEMKVLERKSGIVGSTYEQSYKEGNKVMKYIVTDLEHEDTPTRKHSRSGFQLAKMFDIEADYVLEKISENETRFIYSGSNKGLNFIGKAMLRIMPKKQNQKVVNEFMERVKHEALKENI